MPGYIIHIAIAKEYFKKHEKNQDKHNFKEFVSGSIAPDFTTNKQQTHYGKSPAYTNLYKFLENNNLDTVFNKGVFLHLVTDYLFYNYYLDKLYKPQIYDDYDYSNKQIIEKYELEVPNEIKDKIFFKVGTPLNFSMELIDKMIEEISNQNLEDIALEVKSKSKKWNNYKNIV